MIGADVIAGKRAPRGGRICAAANSKSSTLPRSAGAAAPMQPIRDAGPAVASAPLSRCTTQTPRLLPANATPLSPATCSHIGRTKEHPPRTPDAAGHSTRCAAKNGSAAGRADRRAARRHLPRRRPPGPRKGAMPRMAPGLRANEPGAPAAAEPARPAVP